MATQSDEFGTKVALLAGLVVMCAARPLIDRLVPEPKAAADQVRAVRRRAVLGDRGHAAPRRGAAGVAPRARAGRVPGRGRRSPAPRRAATSRPTRARLLTRTPVHIDAATLPAITVGQDVIDFDHTLAGTGMPAGARDAGAEPGGREPGAAASRRVAAGSGRPRRSADPDAGRPGRRAGERPTTLRHYDFDTSMSRCSCRSASRAA